MLVSEYLQLNNGELNDAGVFDSVIDRDSHFFINIVRLKESEIPEFVDAYKHVNERFSDIATLLDAAEAPDIKDKMFRSAYNLFDFSEVNGINLGFAESNFGAGFGPQLRKLVLSDAYQIIKKGSKQPEIFHLVSLFEDNVGPDRISDMIASIIEPDIKRYTLRMLAELDISKETRPSLLFYESGLIKNPYKNDSILFLPSEILHVLPIARDWDDVSRVVSENEIIRKEINAAIGSEWTKWASSDKKAYIKRVIFMDPEACERVINGYRDKTVDVYDLSSSTDYYPEVLLKEIKNSVSFRASEKSVDSIVGAKDIIGIFKEWVENNQGWEVIQTLPTRKREKMVQRLIHLAGLHYNSINNLDMSFESDAGRGPADVKISRGRDKSIIEIKLSSNQQYLHGYQVQVAEYGKAEKTKNLFYVLVDVGNPRRVETIEQEHERNTNSKEKVPELYIIDANEKKAASTFSLDFDWQEIGDIEMPEFDIDVSSFDDGNIE